jgi:hypothetical protein
VSRLDWKGQDPMAARRVTVRQLCLAVWLTATLVACGSATAPSVLTQPGIVARELLVPGGGPQVGDGGDGLGDASSASRPAAAAPRRISTTISGSGVQLRQEGELLMFWLVVFWGESEAE